jgi:G:T-mismatch repair DNA endonuclease (very short patch repair protein)
MYLPLVKTFNYALDWLSGFDVPGLPEFQEKRQIVFACSSMRCIKSESYLQGSYKPDIILVRWDTFKQVHGCMWFEGTDGVSYWQAPQ